MTTKEEVIRKPNIPIWRTKRYQMALLYCLAFLVQGILMYNLSISIVCMVKHDLHDNEVNTAPFSNETTTNNTRLAEGGEFLWSKQIQGLLLGAMFWGYMAAQIPSGWLSQRYGARMVVGIGVGGASVVTLLSPLAARTNIYLFLATRLIFGALLTVIYPSLATFWSKWAPPSEYSRLLTISLLGCTIGNAVVFPIGGILCGDDVSLGWPFVFYITGGVSAIWSMLWIVFARNTPSQSPGISAEEREYIEDSLRHRVSMKRVRTTPWRKMFTSRPVIAVITTHFLSNFVLYMLLTQAPTYYNDILKLDIKANGVYSMLPVICMGVVVFAGGQLCDFFISRKIFSVGVTRKIVNALGTLFPGIFMVILAQANQGQDVFAVALMCLTLGFMGFGFSSYCINYGDIALQYAGTLSGIGNAISSLPGVAAPYIVSQLTPNGTRQEWQLAFYVTAAIAGLSALVFTLFGSGELQPWATRQSAQEVIFIEKPNQTKTDSMLKCQKDEDMP
ncbi:uncharacterized transporter slc-17.2-like [Haliotis cracherodii]|uniref:uncharacterized transporter slc-17.2-like n=1 Tax=Haliotis cracherodii TaxID=6455 RepID=UPI0039ED000D